MHVCLEREQIQWAIIGGRLCKSCFPFLKQIIPHFGMLAHDLSILDVTKLFYQNRIRHAEMA